MKNILLTGGAGYVGSHTCIELIDNGYVPIIIDNFSNSSKLVFDRIKELTQKSTIVIDCDIRDTVAVSKVIADYECSAAIHFAGSKAVGESTIDPIKYYNNNIVGSFSVLQALLECDVKKIIFSSSATVYGEPTVTPISETHPLAASSVYGETKLVVENMMKAVFAADPDWSIVSLRYFNPVGAHPSGLVGESPLGTPNNLMPIVSQVATGAREYLNIYGNDYDTIDGTCVRDYIHVSDVALGHVKAVDLLREPRYEAINLGRGIGVSVLELIHKFEEVSGKKICYKPAERRMGDVASCYADPSKAKKLMGWQSEKNLNDMCADAWRWQSSNPKGYT